MTKFYSPKHIQDQRATSPARVYADAFLYETFSYMMPKKEIAVLDVGCGSGYIRKIFHDLGYRVDYTGIDIKKNEDFDRYSIYAAWTKLIISEIEHYQTEKKFDVVISMFALEHIENDVLAIKKMGDMLLPGGMQFHMAPSTWSFPLYLRHGHRRYSPQTMKRLFGDAQIYRMGGAFSFLTHFFLITVMKRMLKTTIIYRSSFYPRMLKIANILDRFLPICPIAYIIIKKTEQ